MVKIGPRFGLGSHHAFCRPEVGLGMGLGLGLGLGIGLGLGQGLELVLRLGSSLV